MNIDKESAPRFARAWVYHITNYSRKEIKNIDTDHLQTQMNRLVERSPASLKEKISTPKFISIIQDKRRGAKSHDKRREAESHDKHDKHRRIRKVNQPNSRVDLTNSRVGEVRQQGRAQTIVGSEHLLLPENRKATEDDVTAHARRMANELDLVGLEQLLEKANDRMKKENRYPRKVSIHDGKYRLTLNSSRDSNKKVTLRHACEDVYACGAALAYLENKYFIENTWKFTEEQAIQEHAKLQAFSDESKLEPHGDSETRWQNLHSEHTI